MATMIPPVLPDDAPDSERLVFRLLGEDPATDGWFIFHSLEPNPAYSPGRRRGRRPEIDFFVLIPGIAALCIGAKGGRFELRGGEWYLGHSDRPSQSPIQQAESAMFAALNELTATVGREWDDAELPIGCAVIFTDVNWPAELRPPERPVIGLPDLLQQGSRTLAGRLLEIARRIRSEIPDTNRLALDARTIRAIVEYLAPDKVLEIVAVARPIPYRSAERQIVRLTEGQFNALEIVNDNDRCLFTGGAGTGKTMLALELARRRVAAGDRVALLCYNRILGDWLFEQFIPDFKLGSLAGSFWYHFAYGVIQQNDSLWRQFSAAMDNAVDQDERFDRICPEYTMHALLDIETPMFDYLIVDELQDICTDPYLEIMDLVLDGGLSGGRWTMFADFNQRTGERNPNSAPRNLDAKLGDASFATRNLDINCRNTQAISDDSARLIPDAPRTGTPPVIGPRPDYRFWSSETELRAVLDRKIDDLVRLQGERPGDIIILGTGTHGARAEYSSLDLTGGTYGGYRLFDCPGIYWPAKAICDQQPCCQTGSDADAYLKFRTVRRFKGMESKIVILIVERLNQNVDIATVYIGLTRARVRLVVLAHESTRGNLSGLIGRPL